MVMAAIAYRRRLVFQINCDAKLPVLLHKLAEGPKGAVRHDPLRGNLRQAPGSLAQFI